MQAWLAPLWPALRVLACSAALIHESLSLSPCLCVSLSSVSSHLFISPFLLVSASLGKSLWVSCLSFIFKYLCIYFYLLAI